MHGGVRAFEQQRQVIGERAGIDLARARRSVLFRQATQPAAHPLLEPHRALVRLDLGVRKFRQGHLERTAATNLRARALCKRLEQRDDALGRRAAVGLGHPVEPLLVALLRSFDVRGHQRILGGE